MIGYLGFDDAYHRLLGVAYGERALLPASICRAPDGQFCVVLPDPCLTLDEARAAKAALLLSLRAGDNVGFVMVDGIPQRLPFLNWYRPAYWAVPPPDTRPDQDDEGRPILLDEARFEAWLSVAEEPAEGSPVVGEEAVMRSGAPGRPSSMHLVEGEFERRVAAGITWPTKTLAAEDLSNWLKDKHSNAPRLTAQTILNRLRGKIPTPPKA